MSTGCYKNFLNHSHLKSTFDVRDQLKTILEKLEVFVKDDFPLEANPIPIKKCILEGYFTHLALLQKNNVYLTVKDAQVVVIHPDQCCPIDPSTSSATSWSSPRITT
jgi:ATP-dependent RNA helicase DDX35